MSNFPQSQQKRWELEYGTDEKVVFNFFNAVYAWMAVGLAVTAAVAWFVSQTPALRNALYGTGRGGFVAIALGMVLIAWGVRAAAERIGAGVATVLFLIYATITGAMLSGIFLIYRLETIGAAFLMTGGVFGAMSIYGYITKRDLTTMGSILVMCVIGLFIASLVNIFLASNALSWLITYAVLAVFIGLTAYDTQKLKAMAYATQGNTNLASRYAIVGSLVLYVDFINIFISILRILGSRK